MMQDDNDHNDEPSPEEAGEGDQSAESEKEPKKEEKKDKKEKSKNREDDYIPLGSNFQIDPNDPIKKYDVENIRAYRAYEKNARTDMAYFALICAKDPAPRFKKIIDYKSFINVNLCTLITHGVIYWPSLGREFYALVYRDNLGLPILEKSFQAGAMKTEVVLERILDPLVQVLIDLRDKNIMHGAIRPWNIWSPNPDSLENIVLGECLSLPPSYAQPVLYEPVHRAMADPLSRGEGAPEDDMYALGVTLTALLRNIDATAGMSDEEIIQRKLEVGSYGVVTGQDRFTGSVLELLRGLLHDEESQRWDLEEVQAWMGGRRLSPKALLKRQKAPRPIMFANERYFQLPVLAMALEEDPIETKRIVNEGDLEHWLHRSLENTIISDKVAFAKEFSAEAGAAGNYEERLMSTVSMAMDPDAPIRYGGYHMRAGGVGRTVSKAVALGKDVKVLVELLAQGIVTHWLSEHDKKMVDYDNYFNKFEAVSKFVVDDRAGFGVERAVYMLDSDSPCLSPKLKNYYVLHAMQILPAYEDQCRKKQQPEKFLDRHIIAFIFSKHNKLIDLIVRDYDVPQEHKVLIAELKILARLQKNFKQQNFPHLAQVLAKKYEPIYNRFHDTQLRKRVEQEIDRHAKTGDLSAMLEVLDNLETQEQDFKSFKQAMTEYSILVTEDQKLRTRLADKQNFGKRSGRNIGAAIASIISGLIILGMVVLFLTGGGF